MSPQWNLFGQIHTQKGLIQNTKGLIQNAVSFGSAKDHILKNLKIILLTTRISWKPQLRWI